jgi:iron uptake system EfeUOB component EfeO/EfeM
MSARQIVATLCNERCNSDIRADDPELLVRIDTHFSELERKLAQARDDTDRYCAQYRKIIDRLIVSIDKAAEGVSAVAR